MPDAILGLPECDATIYERIGRIASEWSWVESLLAEMLSHFCRADAGAMYVITQNVSSSTVSSWLKTLTEIRISDLQSRSVILDLLNEIDHVRAERNTVVHGLWSGYEAPGFGIVRTMRWDRAEVARTEMHSIADLDALIAHIRSIQLGLGNLGIRMGFLVLRT